MLKHFFILKCLEKCLLTKLPFSDVMKILQWLYNFHKMIWVVISGGNIAWACKKVTNIRNWHLASNLWINIFIKEGKISASLQIFIKSTLEYLFLVLSRSKFLIPVIKLMFSLNEASQGQCFRFEVHWIISPSKLIHY